MKLAILTIIACSLVLIGTLLFEMCQLKEREELKPFTGQKVIFARTESGLAAIQ